MTTTFVWTIVYILPKKYTKIKKISIGLPYLTFRFTLNSESTYGQIFENTGNFIFLKF